MNIPIRPGAIATLANGVVPFVWDRLQMADLPQPVAPCLAEDWFVEDCLAAGSPFVWRNAGPEQSHRLLYRLARKNNCERLFKHGKWQPNAEWLLFHQMVELIPALFAVAASVSEEQGIAA